jgi:glycine/D-amino acid oxidase-like deaminating enzyme
MLLPFIDHDIPLRELAALSFAEYPEFVSELHNATNVDAELILEAGASGSVDNRKLGRAVYEAAVAFGVEFRLGVAARNVVSTASHFQLVELADGSAISADAVVIAAGAWSNDLLGLPMRVPVIPVRGQMLAVEHVPPLVPHIVESVKCYLVPRGDRLLIGATVERVGFNEDTTETGIAGLLAAARELLPAIANARVLETWAGLRPGTPDDLPILGADPNVENVFYATGHYRNGILLAPVTARVMAELIAEGSSSVDLGGFSIGRFRVAVDDPRCDLCGAPMNESHCKIICPNCGYQRDCSDP